MRENIWFTSDNHFGHKNIKKFCPNTRKGETADEMNELMVEMWNRDVKENDRVYCLGDFSFMPFAPTEEILKRLKGNKYLIKGNHDYWINHSTKKYWQSIDDYKTINIDNHRLVLFHYPIVEFDRMHHGSFHLYGHVHNNYKHPGRAMDVGIDTRPEGDMSLWSWEEVRDLLKDRPIIPHHDRIIL